MSNPWFRLYYEFAMNPKVQMLSEADQRRFIMVLCARCHYGDKPYPDSTAVFEMRISSESWKKTKATLFETNLIDDQNRPVNWDKRQWINDTSTARTAKYRLKKKQKSAAAMQANKTGDVTVTARKQTGDVTVTLPDTDTDTETETETETRAKTGQKTKSEAVPYKKIIELYHTHLPELASVVKLTAKRKSQLRQRFKEDLNSLEKWENFFIFVRQSDFLMGRAEPAPGRTVFRADIEWLTNTTNFTKIAEDKYHV